jgi:hypothetical protein
MWRTITLHGVDAEHADCKPHQPQMARNERSAHEATNGAKASDRLQDHGVIGTSLAITLAAVRTGARHAALPLHL